VNVLTTSIGPTMWSQNSAARAAGMQAVVYREPEQAIAAIRAALAVPDP